MANRTPPRRSNLAGRSTLPTVPPALQVVADQQPEQQQPEQAPAPEQPKTQKATTQKKAQPEKRKKPNTQTKVRLMAWVLPELDSQLRSAYDRLAGRRETYSEWIARLVVEKLHELEAEHNDGKPFPKLDDERLRPGPKPKLVRETPVQD